MNLIATADVVCPHCGETFPLAIDTSQGEQTLVEDCSICCQPMTLTISSAPGEILQLEVAS